MPKKIQLKAGTVAWCTCGKSDSHFCNGSHVGTDKKPFVEKIEHDRDMFVCDCGRTENFPFCSGAHLESTNDK